MRVLVACEFSGVVREAFRERGHDAWSCDLLPTEIPGQHIEGDVIPLLRESWDLIIAHPPCTYLCRAGWSWVNKPDSETLPLKGEPRRRAAIEAAKFFMLFLDAAPRVAVENPRPISHVGLPTPTQTIHPWQFGHGETKATCLWLRGLPKLEATHRKDDLFAQPEPKEREPRLHKLPPGPDRWKDRSRTLSGIAAAMAKQWGEPTT